MTNQQCVDALRDAGSVELDGLPIKQRTISKFRNKRGQLYDIVNLWAMDKDSNRRRLAVLIKTTCRRVT